MAVLLAMTVVMLSAQFRSVYASEDLLPFEPVQYLKGQLLKPVSTPFTNLIGEATPTQAADFITKAKKLLSSHLGNSGTSAVLVKGERVMVQRRAKGLQWDSKIKLPYANTISLVTTLLPILLEGFKGSTINDPIGKVLRGNDLNHPLVVSRKSLSFMDIVNKLPSTGKKLNLDSSSLLSSLSANGELLVHFVNTILDNAAQEAWNDALMAIGSADIQRDTNGQLVLDMNSLLQFSLTLSHDLNTIGAALKKERIPLDDDKYLFGWWFNCPKDSSASCLIPNAPADTIFSLSPDLRLYVTPSLELTLIVLGPEANSASTDTSLKSIADVLIKDAEIWSQLTSFVADDQGTSESSPTTSEEKNLANAATNEDSKATKKQNDQAANENDNLNAMIHFAWPIIVFLFWVTFSHIWVYWMLHIIWFVVTSVFKNAYVPRPKTAAES